MTVPLAVATAVFLNETTSRFRRPVRIFVDAMSGLPSVVAGLFIFAVLIVPFAERTALFSYNGFMASLALTMVMLPTITRTVDVVLRLVPNGLREASLALGASRARTVWSVVLPTARSGVTTAVVLGVARAVGETAPLFFTAFGYDLMNANPFSGAQDSLPLFIIKNIRKPSGATIDRGFAGAVVLLVIVLSLFLVARIAGRDRTTSSRPGRVAALRARARRTSR
jgi:phosphate transport system permease protein